VKTKILKKNRGHVLRSFSDLSSEALQGRRMERGFTLVELLVVIAIIALLMAVLLPALTKARRATKRVVCMSNMRQLITAWMAYAENNDGKIVNGGQHPVPITDADIARTEPYWCTGFHTSADPGLDWNFGDIWGVAYYTAGTPILTYDQRVEKLKKGALYRYIQNLKVYRCLESEKFVHRSYSITNSMNAHSTGTGVSEGKVFKRTMEIKKSAERLVFIEELLTTPDCMQVTAQSYSGDNASIWPTYNDWPGILHGNGATAGLADGHCDFWKWQCSETIDAGMAHRRPITNAASGPQSCKKDAVRVQVAVWGDSLNYSPSPSDMP